MNEVMCPSFTHVPEGTDIFINVTVTYCDNLLEFHQTARDQIERQGTDTGLKEVLGRYDLILYSAVPWIQYTHVVRTIAKSGIDSNPKITWGKYFKQRGGTLMPFSAQVHHGLMDGLHVGRYFEAVQAYLDKGLTC